MYYEGPWYQKVWRYQVCFWQYQIILNIYRDVTLVISFFGMWVHKPSTDSKWDVVRLPLKQATPCASVNTEPNPVIGYSNTGNLDCCLSWQIISFPFQIKHLFTNLYVGQCLMYQGSHQKSENIFPDFRHLFPWPAHKFPWPFLAFVEKFSLENNMIITTFFRWKSQHLIFFSK